MRKRRESEDRRRTKVSIRGWIPGDEGSGDPAVRGWIPATALTWWTRHLSTRNRHWRCTISSLLASSHTLGAELTRSSRPCLAYRATGGGWLYTGWRLYRACRTQRYRRPLRGLHVAKDNHFGCTSGETRTTGRRDIAGGMGWGILRRHSRHGPDPLTILDRAGP